MTQYSGTIRFLQMFCSIKIGCAYYKNDFGNTKRVLTEGVGLDYTLSHVPLFPPCLAIASFDKD